MKIIPLRLEVNQNTFIISRYVEFIDGCIAECNFSALDGFDKTMIGNAPLVSWLLLGIGGLIVINAWPRK